MCDIWIVTLLAAVRIVSNIGQQNRFNLLTPTVAILTAIRHTVPDRVKPSFVIFDIRALSVRVPGYQKLQMTDSLIRSGTGCFIAVPIRQQWASKG